MNPKMQKCKVNLSELNGFAKHMQHYYIQRAVSGQFIRGKNGCPDIPIHVVSKYDVPSDAHSVVNDLSA